MKRGQPGRLITFFITVLMITLLGMISGANAIGLIIAKVTSAPSSCKMGESIKVKYSTLGLEYDSVTGFLQFYAVPKKDTMDPCILLHEVEVTADSSGEYSYTVDESAGEWLRICLARNDPYVVSGKSISFYVHITDGKPRKEFSESALGTSGWVTKNGKNTTAIRMAMP